ncbi:hypothetical protein AAC387_Pa11g0761 [Persea americana]
MATPPEPSNEILLEQLRDGTAKLELASSPTPLLLPSKSHGFYQSSFPDCTSHRFFARIGSSLGGSSSAMRKLEHYSVQKVTGDGRCLFRALVKGMAKNKGSALSPQQEKDDADELRMAVKEIICGSNNERLQYEEALIAITVDESLKRYCQRIERSDFWGGESELLVLSRLCRLPILVYIPEHEHRVGAWGGGGFIPIAEYGSEFRKASKKGKPRQTVRLLYSGKNHYDLLV